MNRKQDRSREVILVLKTKAIVEDSKGRKREVEAILEKGTPGFGPVLRIGETGGHWYLSTFFDQAFGGSLDLPDRVLCHGSTKDVLINAKQVIVEATYKSLGRS